MEKTSQVQLQEKIKKLAFMGILSAIVAVLSYFGGFIKIGGLASISLTLIPVVFGSALYGPLAGAWLGGVSGVIFFLTPDAVFWYGLSVIGTVITVLVKGILAGFFAGLVYRALEKKNRYLAVMVSAVVCPVVNTGVFLGGCLVFFSDFVKTSSEGAGMSVFGYLIVFFVGLNFVFELLTNVIISPALLRVLNLKK